MLGVVLWCDSAALRALIWCEDHGELAYYQAGEAGAVPVAVEAGDLVHVVLSATHGMRRARTLRVVARRADAELPRRLAREAAG